MIELLVNGTPYTDFTYIGVNVSIESLANDFSFTASAVNAFPPFKQGDSVIIKVGGETKLTGYIDEISGSDAEGGHAINYSGRDRTGDLVDSQINKIDELRPNNTLTLKKIIEIVLDHIELDIDVIDTVNPAVFNVAEDRIDPQVGSNAFDFLLPLARKRQVILTSTPEGNLLITQSEPIDSGATLQSLRGSDSNNILSQSWSVNGSAVFNKYIHRGQLDPRALNFAGSSGVGSAENQGAEVTYPEIRQGRQRVVVESESYSNEQLQNRAKWAKQLTKAQAVRFNCAVRGHKDQNGNLWDINTLVQINSDVANITRKMLINTITFSQGEGQPTITNLQFVEKNVYTINERLLSQKPAGSQNDIFSTLG